MVKSKLLRELEKEITGGVDFIAIPVDFLLNNFPISAGSNFPNKNDGDNYVLFHVEIINFIKDECEKKYH